MAHMANCTFNEVFQFLKVKIFNHYILHLFEHTLQSVLVFFTRLQINVHSVTPFVPLLIYAWWWRKKDFLKPYKCFCATTRSGDVDLIQKSKYNCKITLRNFQWARWEPDGESRAPWGPRYPWYFESGISSFFSRIVSNLKEIYSKSTLACDKTKSYQKSKSVTLWQDWAVSTTYPSVRDCTTPHHYTKSLTLWVDWAVTLLY